MTDPAETLVLSETAARHFTDAPGAARLVEHEDLGRRAPTLTTPTEDTVLLGIIERLASDPTIDLDRVEKLLTIRERMQERDAARQFTEAMALFKTQPIRIVKDKHVSFPTQTGTTSYKHATLGAVCEAIIPGLAAVGISHRWDLSREQARVVVTCVLTHRAGHSTKTSWDGPPDDSGKKNVLQQGSSTISYLERYTLLAATGFGTAEQDDDGQAGGAEAPEREPPPEGYENWARDMDAIDSWAALKKAWDGSNGLFRGYATSFDARWWETRKAAAKAGMTTVAYIKDREASQGGA